MITLNLNKAHTFKVGEVIHLKVTEIYMQFPGRWRLTAQDVTPLPGAEPTGYACAICGIIEEAKPDGSLPDGWVERKYEEGSCFVCSDSVCQEQPMCRVCGCTNEHACETDEGPCHWVEDDLCSACAAKVK
ncbi:MAG TPA: hypothetical protein VMW64_08125 [Dehalococcoidia bacterium]|nr:hypothetical protein [Dehalococcoidia bacterium]